MQSSSLSLDPHFIPELVPIEPHTVQQRKSAYRSSDGKKKVLGTD